MDADDASDVGINRILPGRSVDCWAIHTARCCCSWPPRRIADAAPLPERPSSDPSFRSAVSTDNVDSSKLLPPVAYFTLFREFCSRPLGWSGRSRLGCSCLIMGRTALDEISAEGWENRHAAG